MFIIWKNNIRYTLEQLGKWVKNTPYNPFLYKDITRQIKHLDEPLQLMVAGVFSSGKSTFLNTFIGEELLSSSKRAETAIITKLTYGKEKALFAHYKDGRENNLPIEWLASLITSREGEGTFLKPYIDMIEIKLPLDILKHVELIDSPGIDANQEHNSISEEYFNHIDAALWLFFYESAGKVVETTFIQKLRAQRIPVYGIINHVDQLMEIVDDEEGEEVQSSIKDIFQQVQVRSNNSLEDEIIGLTAYHALEAKLNHNEEDLLLSNWHLVDNLLTEIRDDDSIKYKKQYFSLTYLLHTISAQIEEHKKGLELDGFSRFVNHFCLSVIDDFYSYYEEKMTEIKDVEIFLDKWCSFDDFSIVSMSDLQKIKTELMDLSSNSPSIDDDHLKLYLKIDNYLERHINNIKQWQNRVQEYQAKLDLLKNSEWHLWSEWNKLKNRKWMGVRRLNKFEKNMQNTEIYTVRQISNINN